MVEVLIKNALKPRSYRASLRIERTDVEGYVAKLKIDLEGDRQIVVYLRFVEAIALKMAIEQLVRVDEEGGVTVHG